MAFILRRKGFKAHVAQEVEHFLGKEEVTGSSPVVGSSAINVLVIFERKHHYNKEGFIIV